jgi:signal-transduction protein with cAMP-binding, CBS, and nucleotidyltransferase domain
MVAIGRPMIAIDTRTFWSASVNFDSSSFIAEKELIDSLEKRSSSVVCREDRKLFSQGSAPTGLYILRKGKASLSMESPTGGILMSIILFPGSLLGLPALIGNEPYTLTATAHAGAELGFITREDFNSLMLSDPTVAVRVLKVLAAEVRTARHAISEF